MEKLFWGTLTLIAAITLCVIIDTIWHKTFPDKVIVQPPFGQEQITIQGKACTVILPPGYGSKIDNSWHRQHAIGVVCP